MADTGLKAIVSAIVVGGAVALIGATTQPFWWCNVFACAPKVQPTVVTPTLPPATTSPTQPVVIFKPHMGDLLMGTNLGGADLNDGEIVADAQTCRARCAADDTCLAMTYVMIDAGHRENGHCWLKDSKPKPTSNTYMISAIKVTG